MNNHRNDIVTLVVFPKNFKRKNPNFFIKYYIDQIKKFYETIKLKNNKLK
jgi:hypothetical protein